MPDNNKTQEQLAQEIESLRSQLTDLRLEHIKRKQAEEELWESERRFLRLLDGLPLAVFVLDTEGKPYYQNKASRELLGKDFDPQADGRLPETYQAYLARTDQPYPQERSPIRRALDGESSTVGDMEIRRADKTIPVEVYGSPIYNPLGGIKYAVGVFHDISERLRTEEALRRSEAFTRAIITHSPVGITVRDREGSLVLYNEAWKKTWTLTDEKVQENERISAGWSFEERYPHLKAYAPNAQQLFQEGGELFIPEVETGSPDPGVAQWVSLHFYALKNAEGQVEQIVTLTEDITARKRTQEALRSSEALSRAVIEHSPVGITIRKSSWELVLYNQAWKSLWAMTDQEVEEDERRNTGLSFDDRFPLTRPWSKEVRRVFEAGGEYFIPEMETHHPNPAAARWISLRYYALQNETGEVQQVVTLTEDITERKRAEEALEESEERYRAVMDQTAEGIILYDVESKRVLAANPAYCKLLGYSLEEMLQLRIYDIVAADPEAIDHTLQHIREKKRAVIAKRQHRAKDGTLIDVEIRANLITFGVREALCVVVRDISDRLQAELALSESEERFRTLVENVNIGIYRNTGGPQGKFVQVNPAMVKMFGYSSAEELMARLVAECYQNPEEREEFIAKIKRQGFARDEGLHLRKKDGSPFWASVTAQAQFDARGEVLWTDGVIEDVTERKRAEEETAKRSAQFKALREIGLELSAKLDLETLLKAIAQRAMDLLGGISCGFYLYRPEQDLLEWRVNVGSLGLPKGYILHRGEGVSGKVLESRSPLMISNYPLWEGRAKILDKFPVGAVMGIPVQWGEEFLGVLNVASEKPGDLVSEHQEMMLLFATQAAIAIRNARIVEILQQSERDYHQLFEQAHDGVIVFEPKGEIVLEVNRRACELYGFTREEFLGMSLERISKDVGQGKLHIQSTFEKGQYYHFETVQYRKDGSEMLLEISASVVTYKDRPAILSINRDITERKKVEEALLKARDELDKRVQERTAELREATKHLEIRNQQLSRILDTGGSMLVSLNLDTLLNEIAKSVRETLGFEIVVLNVVDEVNKEARFAAQVGLGEEARKALEGATVRMKWDDLKSLFQERFRVSRSCYFIPHGTVDWRTHAPTTGPIAQKVAVSDPLDKDPWHPEDALLALVELREKTVAGMFSLDSPRTGKRPSQETLLLLDVFTNLAAVAIDNARLYEQLQRELGERKQAQEALRQAHGELERRVEERTGELRDTLGKLRRTTETTIQAMALIVEMKDPYTAGHQRNVANLATAIAQELNLDAERTEGLRIAALIHDVGKIGIPTEILTRPGPLSELEHHLIRDHPQLSSDILKTIDFSWPVAEIVRQHHEKMDGSGYPRGLKGDEILMEARILVVADVLESLAFHRPYRPGHGIEKALEELSSQRGKLYDGTVVDACLRLFKEKSFNFA
jgi:PAS domain S-box-containing protein/putative nucleotidyltransferase with HDIG domain